MRIVVLPGLDGTELLLADFIKLAPNGITANAIPLPDDPTDDYDSLPLKVAAQLERFAPCHLVAESFSGPVGIRIAFQFPDIVNALTLVASFAKPPVSRIVRCFPWSLIFRAPLPLAAARYFFVGPDHEMAVRLRNAICQTSPATLTKRIHCVFTVDVCSELASLRCPVRYLRPTRARLVPSRAIRKIINVNGNVTIHQIDGPHLILQTQPEQAWSAITDVDSSRRPNNKAANGSRR